jgi:LPXTG-motif cell wall-anchored protein
MRAKAARTILAAVGALVVATGLAVSGTPAPAFAAGGMVDLFLYDVTLAAHGGVGKAYPIFTLEEGTLTNVKLTIDLSKLAGIATASFPNSSPACTISGTTATCDLPDNSGDGASGDGNIGMIPLKLVPDAGAIDGVTTSISATISADGATSRTYMTPVRVVDGPDLSLTQQLVSATLQPGDSTDMPYGLQNTGSKAADGVEAEFLFTSGMTPYQYHNCAYFSLDQSAWIADCEFDQTLQPGDALTGTLPLGSLKSAALSEVGVLVVQVAPSADDKAAIRFAKLRSRHLGSGSKRLALRSAEAKRTSSQDIDQIDNVGAAEYSFKTHNDLDARPVNVSGSVGQKVMVAVSVRDNGPAALNSVNFSVDENEFSLGIFGFLMKTPEWASVEKAPTTCEGRSTPDGPGHPGVGGYAYYYCTAIDEDYIPVNGSFTERFTFKIKSADGANGSVSVDTTHGSGKADNVASNNVAAITLGAPSTPSLPVTGSKAGLVAGGGAVLVLLGGGLFYLGRRRKRVSAA